MLAPLPAGNHTLHYSGDFIFTQAEDGFDFHFTLDISYDLTIAPKKQ
jgi:hypothetical protein